MKATKATNIPAGRILIIGYGNPGRCDDGLGPQLAKAVAAMDLAGVSVETNYQLNIEDAERMAEFDCVIFADASVDCVEPFAFTPLEAKPELNFSTHSVAPEALLAMTKEIFGTSVVGYALAIRGYRFNEFDGDIKHAGIRKSRCGRVFHSGVGGGSSAWVFAPGRGYTDIMTTN